MRLKFLDTFTFPGSFDKEHKSNLNYISGNNLHEKLLSELGQNKLNKVIFLSGFTFLMTFYIALMDYVTRYSSDNDTALMVYRIIDPVYCIFSLSIYILSKLAKIYNNLKFSKTIIYTYLIVSVVNYAMVSSIEQFDFKHHPSFVLCILLLSILFTIKPWRIILFYCCGILVILSFHTLFHFAAYPKNVIWSVTVFALPLSVAISKINYNNVIKIFVDKIELKGINERLQEKVDTKTRELEDTNEKLKVQLDVQGKYKETLEEAKEKAEKSDRLKTAFLSNLSHEIRTPLNSIIGFSSLLNNPEIDPEKTRRYTGLINKCGKELVYIIDQLVEISKIESGEIEVNKLYFMVNDLLYEIQEKTIDRLRELKKNHVSFSIENPCYERNIRLYSDLVKIKQVLDNLVENSIKFTDTGKIEIGFMLHGDKSIIFHVKDTGIGITEKDKESLFEQFSQGNTGMSRKYGGLGLGLSISRTYIELLGGRMWFESEEGKGTIFYVNLPVV